MKLINDRRLMEIHGGTALSAITSALGRSYDVLSDAMSGNAPSPFPGGSFLTSTAKGPTPGNVGGRYPVSQLGAPRRISNVGGGQIGRAVAEFFIVVTPTTDN